MAAPETLVNQGAEARVYRSSFLVGDSLKPVVVKERFSKKYRHPDLDRLLTRRRLKSEAKCLQRARDAGIDVPILYRSDTKTSRLYMEDIGTLSVKLYLWGQASSDLNATMYTADCMRVCRDMGGIVACMHNVDLIHGDLTTSNFLLRHPHNTLVSIDFGLSYVSFLIEDKAVDLYVLERAFLCTHPSSSELFHEVLAEYAKKCKNGDAILKRLDVVRTRGRKKLAFG